VEANGQCPFPTALPLGKTLPVTVNQEATASALELFERFSEENDFLTYMPGFDGFSTVHHGIE
jgi:hypothetical protein